MPQFPSPSSPPNPDSDSNKPPAPPRRLLSPQERSAPRKPCPMPFQVVEISPPDPFVAEPPSSRLEDEMARRHLPPHERRRHARTLKKRAKREAKRRIGAQTARHETRAAAERDFAATARLEAPAPRVKKQRRVPIVFKRLFWLVCLLFCVQLGFAAFSAPQFAIQTVAIEGAGVTPEDELRPLAARLIGQNYLRANSRAVEHAVEAIPTVASARVIRLAQWPPRVELRIAERQPVLKVGAGENWWVADDLGVPFRRSSAADESLYTVVAPQFSPKIGQKLPAAIWQSARALNAAIRADNTLVEAESRASTASASPVFWQLRRIYFDKDGLASLRLTGKGALIRHNEMLVRLGDDAWSEKLARARVALSYFERTGRRAQELDLVSLERPVWRPFPAPMAVKTEARNGDSIAG